MYICTPSLDRFIFGILTAFICDTSKLNKFQNEFKTARIACNKLFSCLGNLILSK